MMKTVNNQYTVAEGKDHTYWMQSQQIVGYTVF